MATTVARLEAVLSADTRKFDQAMNQSSTRMTRAGVAARTLGFAVAGALGAALIKGVGEAIEAEREHARLEQAFKNANIAIGPYKASIEAAGKAAIQMGFDDEAATRALGSLITATGDYKLAREDLTVAMDLARFKSIDLESATKTLTMAMGGSQRAVKQLGISVTPVTTEYDKLRLQFGAHLDPAEKVRLAQAKINDQQRTAALVIDTVRQKTRGQAEAFSKTAAGEMEVFRAKSEELSERVGKKLLPVLTDVVRFLSQMVDKLEKTNEWMAKVGANKGLIDILDQIGVKKGPSAVDVFRDMANAVQKLANGLSKVKESIEWLINNIKKIPSIPGLPSDQPVDPNRRGYQGGGGDARFTPKIWDETDIAKGMGMTIGSHSSGRSYGDHGRRPSHAIDAFGRHSQMDAFARMMYGRSGSKDVFYGGHNVWQDQGRMISGWGGNEGLRNDHMDHVHYSVFDKGGWLMPGLTLAANNTGRPERVGGSETIIVQVGNEELVRLVRNEKGKFERRNGPGTF